MRGAGGHDQSCPSRPPLGLQTHVPIKSKVGESQVCMKPAMNLEQRAISPILVYFVSPSGRLEFAQELQKGAI